MSYYINMLLNFKQVLYPFFLRCYNLEKKHEPTSEQLTLTPRGKGLPFADGILECIIVDDNVLSSIEN